MMNKAEKLLAVAFDLDGTLVNSEDLYEQAGLEVLRRRGKLYDSVLREQMMGRPFVESLRLMIDYHSLPDPLDELLHECRQILEKWIATSLAALPGACELFDLLDRAGIPYCVATSGTHDYADYVLTKLEIKQRLQFILTAEDVERGKPDPAIYLLAASLFGIAPSQMMILEDSANGCRSGIAAGGFTIAVPNRHTRDHDFAGVRIVANSLADPDIPRALRIDL